MRKILIPFIVALLAAGCSGAVKMPQKNELKSLPYIPKRIVSINPCGDAILVATADKNQILALSHYSRDPRSSVVGVKLARQFATTYQTAEEVIALEPDLVVAGSHVSHATVAALERLKIPIVNLKVPESIAASEEQITLVANLTGHSERGIALNNRIEAALKANSSDTKIPTLIWQSGGLVPGKGTLSDELLTKTGFANQSSAYGLKKWDWLGLEQLLASPPRQLITSSGADKKDRILNHPALKHISDKINISDYDQNYATCAGPALVDALNRLGAIHHEFLAHEFAANGGKNENNQK